ncbi:MAG: citrate lyase subunit beta [Bacteroidales bacterium]|nr:citrate lyase subunit beta [Bacteroidales bacterium]MCF8333621.1 citrate lyase subunit beta [Bacteroidales bacterium]
MGKTATAGNKGDKIRSDCHVSLELKDSGGRDIEVNTKTGILFQDVIRKKAEEVLNHFDLKNARLVVEDYGALDFVIAARIEAAIKQVAETDKEFLPEIIQENTTESTREQYRFTRLYLPGDSPKLMLNAGIHYPNGVILDLEDAVAPGKKHDARFLVRNALRQVNFYGAERMVRINQGERGLIDLEYVVPHHVNLVLVPKAETAEDIQKVNEKIEAIQKELNLEYPIWLMPIIESALGVVKAYEIASAADNVVAMAIGLEDYTADLGTLRTDEGTESFFARSQLVNAARAAKVQPIDSVFSDVEDMEALKQNVLRSKALGFDGMGCIHPRQIKVIKQNFAPDEAEIKKAKKIYKAFVEAEKKGLGVVSLGTKMIDAPVVKRARRSIDVAIKTGILDPDWMEKEEK